MSDEAKVTTVLEEAQALIKTIEAANLTRGPALEVTDHAELAVKYLRPETITAMAKKATMLVETIDNNPDKISKCIFLGTQVKADQVEKGVAAIAGALNDLAAAGMIVSTLAPISSLLLAKQPLKALTRAVIAYVHVPEDKFEEATKMVKFSITNDSDVPPTGSLDLDLADGEFIIVDRISVAINMLGYPKTVSREDQLLTRINKYKALLPEGTEYIGAEPCAITDLSVVTELKFKNPLLNDVVQVDFDYIRAAAADGDKVVQGSVLVGVRYIKRDGSLRFPAVEFPK